MPERNSMSALEVMFANRWWFFAVLSTHPCVYPTCGRFYISIVTAEGEVRG